RAGLRPRQAHRAAESVTGHVLALDQGTTSSRAIVFDARGIVVAVAQKEFPQHYPRPGWVEHDPLDIWSSQAGVAAEALTRAGLQAGDRPAVRVAHNSRATLPWDPGTRGPLRPDGPWADRPTA